MNAVEIEEAVAELIQQPYEPVAFITGFMAAYGASATTITRLKGGDGNTSDLPGGVLWKKWVHFQPAAEGQASNVLDAIEASRKTAQGKVRYAITTDGDEFSARDLKTGEALFCPLPDLENHFGFFLPIAGIDRYEVADENPVDIKATGKLAKLYDALIAENPDWATDARRHDMNQFMTRVIFCLFAEDTGIFPDNIFSETLTIRCSAHPENIAATLETMFEVMNLNDKDGSRDGQPAWACAFPYVNGGLFAGSPKSPEFDWMGWRYLRDAGKLDWKEINPDIFGSMIQSIVNTDQRGELGMHYTSVPNILKVLNPLFLDGLRDEVESGWDSKAKLQAVLKRLMKIRVFDPACGSGNFLVIAYREMREIEIRVLKRLQEMTGEMAGLWSHVELKNFYGIEIGDFAAETAKLALWIAQHQMNKRFENAFARIPAELPLKEGGQIATGNALRLNWSDVCPPPHGTDHEVYIAGNPPYLGTKNQNIDHKNDIEYIFSEMTENYKSLDYVCGWIYFSKKYLDTVHSGKAAFVTTNSICQSVHVSNLWSIIIDNHTEISFAYRPFHWKNNAKKNAGVTVIIVGIGPVNKEKFIFDDGSRRKVEYINPYLMSGRLPTVIKSSAPLSALPPATLGSLLADGNNFILDDNGDYEAALKDLGGLSEEVVKPYVGGQEFIRGITRHCLYITDGEMRKLESIPFISQRIERVRDFRLASSKAATRQKSLTPHRYTENRINEFTGPDRIIIPITFSCNREYLHAGLVSSNCIIPATAYFIEGSGNWVVSVLSSKMFFVWMTTVGNTLRKDFRFSNTLCWNTFPFPVLSDEERMGMEVASENILLAREAHFPATIAQLYDPEQMPTDLLEAHRKNDEVIEKIYIGREFKNDTERLEHLFKLYTKMVASKGKA